MDISRTMPIRMIRLILSTSTVPQRLFEKAIASLTLGLSFSTFFISSYLLMPSSDRIDDFVLKLRGLLYIGK